jgi:hypothetical protein
MPCQSDLLCGVTQTSVVVVTGLAALTSSLASFLQTRGVQHEHCEASCLWRCEVTDFVHSCKFHVQVYCEEDEQQQGEVDGVTEYTVEFLRISGCPLLFSAQFQAFVSEQQQEQEGQASGGSTSVDVDVSGLAPKAMVAPQQALESFVSWAAADPAEATRAVCGLLAGQSQGQGASSSLTSSDQLSPEGILVMTLLGTLCMQHKEEDTAVAAGNGDVSSSSLPMLSLLRQLLRTRDENDLHPTSCAVLSALVDSLVPATARLTADSSRATPCEREAAVQLMEISSTSC